MHIFHAKHGHKVFTESVSQILILITLAELLSHAYVSPLFKTPPYGSKISLETGTFSLESITHCSFYWLQ